MPPRISRREFPKGRIFPIKITWRYLEGLNLCRVHWKDMWAWRCKYSPGYRHMICIDKTKSTSEKGLFASIAENVRVQSSFIMQHLRNGSKFLLTNGHISLFPLALATFDSIGFVVKKIIIIIYVTRRSRAKSSSKMKITNKHMAPKKMNEGVKLLLSKHLTPCS